MRVMILLLVAAACLILAGCSEQEAQTPAPAEQGSAPASEKQGTTDIYSKVEKATEDGEQQAQAAGEQAQAAGGADISGQEVYTKACVSCHKAGIAGAPVTGDKEAWVPLIDKGMDQLSQNAINGIGKMPAKGGNASLSDAEVRAAVEYMVEQSQ